MRGHTVFCQVCKQKGTIFDLSWDPTNRWYSCAHHIDEPDPSVGVDYSIYEGRSTPSYTTPPTVFTSQNRGPRWGFEGFNATWGDSSGDTDKWGNE